MFSCGGHWCLLQGVAWVNMVHQYSQVVPLTEAVTMTLSGQYPCALCKAIAERKAAENPQACSIEKYDKKFFPPDDMAAANPVASSLDYPVFLERLKVRAEAPPTPPPRLSLS